VPPCALPSEQRKRESRGSGLLIRAACKHGRAGDAAGGCGAQSGHAVRSV
jgi:hypothetical protein